MSPNSIFCEQFCMFCLFIFAEHFLAFSFCKNFNFKFKSRHLANSWDPFMISGITSCTQSAVEVSRGWVILGVTIVIRFLCYWLYLRAEYLPVPVALYPLNGRHGTKDIGPNKNPPGIPNDVHLAPGPHGHPQGSYQFSGRFSSYIEIPNNGGLDTIHSITILVWVKHENDNGPIVNYGPNVWGFHFWIESGSLYARPSERKLMSLTPVRSPVLSKDWHYVGTSYNFSSGVVKLWVNGVKVAQAISGSKEQSTQYDVRMGAKASTTDQRYFKGRICCLQIYNKSLSQEEIMAVQNRTVDACEYGFSWKPF